jgi:Spy/CpxP family protein refolding chaperone
MAEHSARGELHATISAKVIRADGTEESLGVISATKTQAAQMEKLIKELRDAHPEAAVGGPMSLEEVNALHAQRSEENDRATAEAATKDTEG